MYNPGYLTRNATGGWTLTAVGTNQSNFIVPSGSGRTDISAGNLTFDTISNGTGRIQFPAATTSAGGITFPGINIYRIADRSLVIDGNNSTDVTLTLRESGSSTLQMFTVAGVGTIRTVGSQALNLGTNSIVALTLDSSQGVTTAKKIVSYNGVATTGWGAPSIVATGRFTAQSAAGNITNGSYTVGAADGTFEVSGNINVISAVAVSTSLNVTYTDETNTSRTMILPLSGLAGSFVAAGLATTTGPFESAVMHIRCKANTAITFAVAAGTFTTVSYNAECTIKQTA